MTQATFTEQDMRQGRRRLRHLLPQARALVRSLDEGFRFVSAIAKAQAPFVTERNLEALVIYPAELAGWHVDLLLSKVPSGIANVIGSPNFKPCATRDEAEAVAINFLAAVLKASDSPAPESPRSFVLFDTAFSFPDAVFGEALRLMPSDYTRPGTRTLALDRIKAAVARLFPQGFTGEGFDNLPPDEKALLMTLMLTATLRGVYRYPPRADGTPPAHTADELSQARR